uniref:Uncharacterized protein n=1 Tax=Oryza sativa subsp. japonica TaxID=39947 RepID=Q6ETA3_ORYSJ|nr:hypothetical protein [Oryza sativa Japonica Group]BAD28117.1 hypothetical protein [Oryza sativa Japonica Group]
MWVPHVRRPHHQSSPSLLFLSPHLALHRFLLFLTLLSGGAGCEVGGRRTSTSAAARRGRRGGRRRRASEVEDGDHGGEVSDLTASCKHGSGPVEFRGCQRWARRVCSGRASAVVGGRWVAELEEGEGAAATASSPAAVSPGARCPLPPRSRRRVVGCRMSSPDS